MTTQGPTMKRASMAAIIMGTFASMARSAAYARAEKLQAARDLMEPTITGSGLPAISKPSPNYHGHGHTQRCMNETGNKASRRIAKQIAKGMLKKENGLVS